LDIWIGGLGEVIQSYLRSLSEYEGGQINIEGPQQHDYLKTMQELGGAGRKSPAKKEKAKRDVIMLGVPSRGDGRGLTGSKKLSKGKTIDRSGSKRASNNLRTLKTTGKFSKGAESETYDKKMNVLASGQKTASKNDLVLVKAGTNLDFNSLEKCPAPKSAKSRTSRSKIQLQTPVPTKPAQSKKSPDPARASKPQKKQNLKASKTIIGNDTSRASGRNSRA
jgi:hypothetical protein